MAQVNVIEELYLDGGPSGAMQPNSGSIFHEEGLYLYEQAAKLGGPVLVLGVARGVSDRYVLKGLQKRGGGLLLCADIINYWTRDDAQRWLDLKCPDCTRLFFQHDSGTVDEVAAVERFKDRIKWAFIDGDHRYEGVIRDMEVCERLGIKVLVHHDTRPSAQQAGYSEARRAVMDYIAVHPEWRITRDIQELCGMLTMERD